MSVIYLGSATHDDVYPPMFGKDEWGVDTLDRTVKGSPAWFLEQSSTLAQGQTYNVNGVDFYLQTWKPISDPIFPGFTLSYKGCPHGIPVELVSYDRVELMSQIHATDLEVTISSVGKVVVAATKEVKYTSPQATYRYIRNSVPTGTSFSSPGIGDIVVTDTQIVATYDDGTTQVFAGGAPAALATALAATPGAVTTGPSATPIVGTPYWECYEVVRLQYTA